MAARIRRPIVSYSRSFFSGGGDMLPPDLDFEVIREHAEAG